MTEVFYALSIVTIIKVIPGLVLVPLTLGLYIFS